MSFNGAEISQKFLQQEKLLCKICYLPGKKELLKTNTIRVLHQDRPETQGGFEIGQECLLQWVVIRITKDSLKNNIEIPCPNHSCNGNVSIEEALSELDRDRAEHILDKLINVYICNQQDVRKGPSASCNNAGVITPEPGRQSLQGEGCEYKWKDITQFTVKDKLQRVALGQTNYLSKFLSYLHEVHRGEPCPEGGIVIFKDGGCPHMIGPKGSFEFGWDCIGYFPDYEHKQETYCPLRKFIFVPMLISVFLMVNLKLILSSPMYASILECAVLVICKIVIIALLLISALLEWLIIYKYKRMRKFRPNHKGKSYWIVVAALVGYPIFWYFMISFCNEKLSLTSFIVSMVSFLVLMGATYLVFKVCTIIFKKIKGDHSIKYLLFLFSLGPFYLTFRLIFKGVKKIKRS